MKVLACLLVIGATVILCAGMASAQTGWTEDWEAYTSTAAPYGDWVLDTGVWEPLTGGGAARGNQAYRFVPVTTTRIGRDLGFDASATQGLTLEGWLYDSNGGSTMKRGSLGIQQDFSISKSLVRIGLNNSSSYQVHYVKSGTSVTVVDTGLRIQTGWHYVKLELVPAADGVNWTCNWRIDAADGTPYTGFFTWDWLAESANKVVVGYNLTTSNEVDFDDITVTPNLVSEPGSILALGTGVVGLFGIRRRMA